MKKIKKHMFFKLLISLSLILSLAACSNQDQPQNSLQDEPENIDSQETSTSLDQEVNAANDGSILGNAVKSGNSSYQLKEVFTAKQFYQDLVQIDGGQESLIFPKINQEFDTYLYLLGLNEANNLLIFKGMIPDTDNPNKKLFTYNLKTKELKPLKINEILVGNGGFGAQILSPDNSYLVFAPFPFEAKVSNQLYLVDLVNDDYSLIEELGEGQSFSSSTVGGLSADFDISWQDQETINYTIYSDQENYDNQILAENFFMIK